MSGLDVDTRTDIYALGVLLYELLTGVTPFDKETLAKAAFDEIRRLIQEAEPAKPSTRVHALGDKLTDVAKHRQTEPGGLRRSLRGDLDWIVMKALEKDRRRRYETANDLAEDLERHLGHQAVLAGPPSKAYRARKFIRRHRLGVAFAAAVMVALALGLVVSLIGFEQARRERDRAVAAEKQAKDEKTRARMVSDFLQNDLLDVEGEPDRELKLRTVVGRAEEKIGSRFAGQALVEASIRLTFGRIHLSVAELEAAELHLVRAAELRTKILGSDSLPVLEARKSAGRSEGFSRAVWGSGNAVAGSAGGSGANSRADKCLHAVSSPQLRRGVVMAGSGKGSHTIRDRLGRTAQTLGRDTKKH